MERILNDITTIILDYKALSDELGFNDGNTIQAMLKNLSSNMFFLQSHLDDARKIYYNHLRVSIKDDLAVSRAEILAKADHPEYDMLKQVMRRAANCFESMRSNQSYIKEDLKHK